MSKMNIPEEHLEAVEKYLGFSPYETMGDFLKGLEADSGEAYYELSCSLQCEDMDEKAWAKYLEMAAERGSIGAMEQLADFLHDEEMGGELFEHNEEKAIELYKKCGHESLRAMYVLGTYYLFHNGPEKNPELGIRYLEEVGDRDESMCPLVAEAFESNDDYERAIKYYKKARTFEADDYAEFIDEEGVEITFYSNIALLYHMMGDDENAVKFANKGIVEDIPFCYFVRELIYLDYNDPDTYDERAEKLLKKAADLNVVAACLKLGEYNGDAPSIEYKKLGLEYFEKARKLGAKCDDKIEDLKKTIADYGE